MTPIFAVAVFRLWEAPSIGARFAGIIPAKNVWFGRGKSKISLKPSFARSVITFILKLLMGYR